MSSTDGVFYYYKPEPLPLLEEGVTRAWLYAWSGRPGPARALQVSVLVDEDGHVVVVPDGEWQDVTVKTARRMTDQ